MTSGRVKEGQPMRGKAVMERGRVDVTPRASLSCFLLHTYTHSHTKTLHTHTHAEEMGGIRLLKYRHRFSCHRNH